MTGEKRVLIETHDLRKSFTVGTGPVEVLKGINITIKTGEFVIIFGPSGCGKSTMLHTLLGLEPPTSGKIMVEGQDFYNMTDDERALFRRHKVGMIYQQALWVGSFNVIDNITFPLHLLDKDPEEIQKRATAALEKVGLAQWANYTPTELSSGQQQKISLARSMMTDPLIIVADEPTGNLDTVSGKELIETFTSLVGEGKTIIMVTHDLEYLKYATKIFHMVDGLVVEEYSPSEKSKFKDLGGKKEIAGNEMGESNVRDPDFLKKLKL
jgi:putative ABC transport system ATP-binding protein